MQMSILLVVIGAALIAVGIKFAVDGKATDTAGGSGLKTFSIEGPAWLVLCAMGLISVGWGVVRWEDRNPPKPQPTEVTEPDNFTYQDDFQLPDIYDYGDDANLDEMWLDCLDGNLTRCDQLYLESPISSEYEWFAATCGYTIEQPVGFCDPANNEGN